MFRSELVADGSKIQISRRALDTYSVVHAYYHVFSRICEIIKTCYNEKWSNPTGEVLS